MNILRTSEKIRSIEQSSCANCQNPFIENQPIFFTPKGYVCESCKVDLSKNSKQFVDVNWKEDL